MTTVVELLIAAKAEIEKQGWRQGPRYADSRRSHEYGEARVRRPGCCAYDAVMDARVRLGVSDRNLGGMAQQMLDRALGRIAISWNDEPGRTVAEVYALYDKAIGMARRQEGAP